MVNKILAIVFCSIFFSVFGVVYAETPFEKGVKEFKEENYEEAIEFFLEARKLDPTSSVVAFFLGLTYKHMQNFKEAVPYLRDAVTFTPKIKEALIELIDVLYLTDNLEEAKKWIEVGEKEDIAPGRLQFLKGLVLLKEGKNIESISSFQKAKELDSTFAQAAEFRIAEAYAKEGKLKEASERLKFSITIDPTTDMAIYARDYEKFLTEKMEREKPFRLSLGLAYKYDTNVVLKPTSGPVAELITGEQDSAINASLRIGYTAPFSFKGPFSFALQYSLYTDTYFDLTRYQWISQNITAIPGYNFGKFSVSFPLSYIYNWVKRRSYMNIKGMDPTLRFMVSENSMGEVSLGYFRKDYATRPLDINEERDGYSVSGSFSWTYFLKAGEGLITLRYSPTNEHTDGNNWSYREHKFSLSLLYPLIWKFKLQLTGDSTFTHYKNTNTVFNVKRKDDTYFTSLGLICGIFKNLDAIASYSYTRDKSNIDVYDYKRQIFSVGLEFRY